MEKLSSKKSRPWEIKDLYNRIASVRAVPILFLEKWEREKGSPGSDRMTTDEINNELVTRDILAKPMARKGVGNLVTGFCQKQRNRDLYPILVEPVDRGVWHFNMSHYETLLRDFRKRYPLMGTGTPPTQGMSHSLVEREIDKVEVKDEKYYSQFDQELRQEAHLTAKHYELFYCLETSIRKLVAETLNAQHGSNWWVTCVPEPIRKNVVDNIQREIDSGVTIRSKDEIDYTTFGELGEIVRNNWDSFDTIFSSQKAFTKIMTNLNILRGPIAHCCPLAEDEVTRLQLTLSDWFRLMK